MGTGAGNDERADYITKEIVMNVSAEPSVMYNLFDSMEENPIECMRVMTEDEPGRWQNLKYELVRILTDKKVEELTEPVEKVVKSETDIEYEHQFRQLFLCRHKTLPCLVIVEDTNLRYTTRGFVIIFHKIHFHLRTMNTASSGIG